MTGHDFGVVGECEQASLDGVDDLLEVAAGEIGAADAACEEGVTGDKYLERREVKADGPLGVARGVEDQRWVALEADARAIVKAFVGGSCLRRVDAAPGGLGGHHLEQWEIAFVEEDGSAGQGF